MSFNKLFRDCIHWVSKKNDKIEFVAGVVLVGLGTASLIKSSEKIADVKRDISERNEFIKTVDKEENGWEEAGQKRRDYVAETLKEAVVGYAKAAGPGVVLIVGGEVLQGVSHVTLSHKFSAVSASLAGVSAKFADYRKAVVEDQGEEKDYEYMVGPSVKTVEVKKDGTVIEKTIPINNDNKRVYIPHSFMFDESNINWENNAVANRDFLETRLAFVNQALSVKRFMTENDIRKYFDAPITIAGQAAGVRYENPDGSTNQISIGLDRNNDAVQRFKDGLETNFLVIIQYSDGSPISDNILDDTDWEKY